MADPQIATRTAPGADDPALAEMVRRLVEVYHPERIYLFGSAARGDAGPDSDYDVMVVVPDDAAEKALDSRRADRRLAGFGRMEVHVLTRQRFHEQLHLKASFPTTIVREGRLLFEGRDLVRIENTREWLRKAARDIRSAEADLSATPPIIEDILFHAQQAAEKALKGLLSWHDRPFGKTHVLKELTVECVRISPDLAPLLERADSLSPYAWMYRYPGAPDEPTLEQAQRALALAREVVDAVLTRLPEDARP